MKGWFRVVSCVVALIVLVLSGPWMFQYGPCRMLQYDPRLVPYNAPAIDAVAAPPTTLASNNGSKDFGGLRPTYCLATRSHYDAPYMNHFLDWYRELGITRFYIQTAQTYDMDFADVQIVKTPKAVGNVFKYLVAPLKAAASTGLCLWTLFVDMDEFLILQRHTTIDQYVRSLPENVTSIQFAWAQWMVFEPFCGPLNLTRLFPANFVKTMVKTSNMIKGKAIKNCHLVRVKPMINWVAGAIRPQINTRQERPVPDGWYSEAILMHVQTRSVSDLLMKWAFTNLPKKMPKNRSMAFDFLSTSPPLPTLESYTQLIGAKLQIPFERTYGLNRSRATVSCSVHRDHFCDTAREMRDMTAALGPNALQHVQAISRIMKSRWVDRL